MSDFNLEDFFNGFDDQCTPTEIHGCTEFTWSAKGVGFGSFYFYFKDNKLMCSNEIMSKEFVKKMLCHMVDEAYFVDGYRIRGKDGMRLEVDGDGFLVDRDVWNTEVMDALARADGVELTADMEEMILLARKMYEDDGVVPPLRVFSKATGGDRKGTHLNEMFDGAPMKKIAKWGGLPAPKGCV